VNDEALRALSDGTFRAHWLNEVLRSSELTESVKVLLLSAAIEEMDPAGRFSVPRQDLAARIGRGTTRITERINEAVDRGFVVRLAPGRKGSTAVYAAALKGSACADLIAPEGSGHADLIKGSPSRTRTIFGSDLQAPMEGDEVRLSGPNDPGKGPHRPATNREEGDHTRDDLYGSAEDGLFQTREGAASRRPPKASKTPLSPDFVVTPAMRAWAAEKCPLVDIAIQTQLFINHFTDRPEIKRPGWVRSWQSWMLRQQGWSSERTPTGGSVRQLRPTGTGGHQPYRNPTDQSIYDEEF